MSVDVERAMNAAEAAWAEKDNDNAIERLRFITGFVQGATWMLGTPLHRIADEAVR